ncbi:MAG: isochorismate synthase [Acidimicrobiales bacterium]|nr:isochorismate synthase [Acidimicrobiales bacterium]
MALNPFPARTDEVLEATTVELDAASAAADPLAWLAAAPDDAWFWEVPEDDVAWVGLGRVASVEPSGDDRFADAALAAEGVLGRLVVDAPDGAPLPRLAAGFAFDQHEPDEHWRPLGAGRLVLPAVQLLRHGGRSWLTAVGGSPGPGPSTSAPAALEPDAVEPADWTDPAEREHYRQLIRLALVAIGRGDLEKAVPCRSIRIDRRPHLPLLLATLRRQYPGCATFCVSDGPTAFVGATPERLAAVHGGRLHTAALAGSAPRHADHAIDDALGQGLLTSPKERLEHAVVVDAVTAALDGLGVVARHPVEPELLRLHGIQHLHTPIDAEVPADRGLLDLVGALHPTPAVSGHPVELASDLRSRHEGMERGWFAGPVGWLDAAGNGEFRVALRSALVEPSGTILYAGAGVVTGSDPERELLETDVKLRAMLGPVLAASAMP